MTAVSFPAARRPRNRDCTKPGVAQAFGYAGQYHDADTGLIYMRARYYDPATGSFLTRDPIETLTREPYAYVGGDPLNMVDPLGLCGWSDPWNCRSVGEVVDVALLYNPQTASTYWLAKTWIDPEWGAEASADVANAAGWASVGLAGITVLSGGSLAPLTIPLIATASAIGIGASFNRMLLGVRLGDQDHIAQGAFNTVLGICFFGGSTVATGLLKEALPAGAVTRPAMMGYDLASSAYELAISYAIG